ncbi:uncharacterized protein LOC114963916 [Acropora millepora]|uniref:uncharacterized protein LOC114963916 n=1 Tax=Acropora millepora TaxID=45264 RepID=UPI001CF24836|nr:uncharacterized protein LOC114963916 [Acropora millepora]
MMNCIVLILAGLAAVCQSGSIHRNKRGYLSRTGLCVNPSENFKIKDPRLNFWGVAYVLPDDANPKCTESECAEDSHCDADRKCCKNYCGGMVCTPTMRDPNPCKKFQCPAGQTCKVQYVPCVMPKCKDAIAVNRPTCIKDPEAAAPAAPPAVAPPAPGYLGQSNLAPSLFNQQPLAYQQQPQQYPQVNQAPVIQQPMGPISPAMPPMTGYQNDELPNAAAFTGNQPDLETTGLSDASLNKALENENQPFSSRNDYPPPVDESSFLQAPTTGNDQSPVASPLMASQPAWDRSTTPQ